MTSHLHYLWDGNCFTGDPRPIDMNKRTDPKATITIHNDSDQPLEITYHVCQAFHSDGTTMNPNQVNPFSDVIRTVTIPNRGSQTYQLHPQMGVGETAGGKGEIHGSFLPTKHCGTHKPCKPHGGIHLDSHTDWHIEC